MQQPPYQQPFEPQWQAASPATPTSPVQPAHVPSLQRVALTYGLISGLIIVVLHVLAVFIDLGISRALPQLMASYALKTSTVAQIFNLLSAFYIVIHWIVYFLAGLFAARRVPSVRTAIFTSLWINLCYTLIFSLTTGFTAFFLLRSLSRYGSLAISAYTSAIITQVIIGLIVLHLLLGTAIAALGGLLATRRVSNGKNSV